MRFEEKKYKLKHYIVMFFSIFSLLTVAPAVGASSVQQDSPLAMNEPAFSVRWAQWLSSLPSGVSLRYRTELSQLYHAENMNFFWHDRQARYQFQKQLAEVALSGVESQFGLWLTWLSEPSLNDTARDMILTDAFLGYLSYVEQVPDNGRRWLYGLSQPTLTYPTEKSLQAWLSAYSQNHLESYLETLLPQHPQYSKMHQALVKALSESDVRPWPHITEGASLKEGNSNPVVPEIREILIRLGMLSGYPQRAEQKVPVTPLLKGEGVADDSSDLQALSDLDEQATTTESALSGEKEHLYSSDLVAGIKRFQEWQGLEPDGVVGKRTREWLNVTPAQRAGLLALNIQRLRLLKLQVDNGILVNIPDYSLVFFRHGKEVLASRVIVGSERRKTPLMDSSLLNVVVNPPWNVPTKLVREDIVPKVKRDPSYLHKLNYTLYSGWDRDSYEVDPSMIDWASVSANSFPYRVRQAPGSNNALGRFKFNMPNSEAIYLHDTPNHGLFKKDIRALSSGCVRVNKAAELANLLLQEVGWQPGRIATTLDRGQTTYINIRERIPVELYYLTAWVGENGIAQYRTDIYQYDQIVRSGAQISNLAKVMLK